MDREELAVKLEGFKHICQNSGYIVDDLYFEEAYPGCKPTSFIVKMIAKKPWLDTMRNTGNALDKLIDVLWDTTDAKTRENVHVLSLYGEDERDLIQKTNIREAV